MAEFNYMFVSVLFGLSGTFIIFFSYITLYRKKIKNNTKFLLVSQLLGFLFLFNSFLYQLYPQLSKINDLIGIGTSHPVTSFIYLPYWFFILVGIWTSLFMVEERDFGGKHVISVNIGNRFNVTTWLITWVIGVCALFLYKDILLLATIVVWFYLLYNLWEIGK